MKGFLCYSSDGYYVGYAQMCERVGPAARAGLHLMADAPEEMRGGRDNQRWRGESCMWERGE